MRSIKIITLLLFVVLLAAGCSSNLKVAKYMDRAASNLEKGQQVQAIKDIHIAINADPSRYRTYAEAIVLLQKKNVYSEQINITDMLIKRSIESKLDKPLSETELADAYLQNGFAYWELRKMRQAEESFKMSLQIDPDNASMMNSLGYLYAEESVRLNEALRLTRRAVKLQPDEAAFIDSLGWVYYKMARYDDSIRELQKAVELAPNIAELRYHLGAAYAKKGRKAEARIELQKALILDKYMFEASKLLKSL